MISQNYFINGAFQFDVYEKDLSFCRRINNTTIVKANNTQIALNPTSSSPYPSVITIPAGRSYTIRKLSLTLNGVVHPAAADIHVLLISFTSFKMVKLMGGCGDQISTSSDITISDDAVLPLPEAGPLVSGTYRPATYNSFILPGTSYLGFNFIGPATASPLSAFIGDSANGDWLLFAYCNSIATAGTIAGWSLNMEVTEDFSAASSSFITNSGLNYINNYAIADCFRYISFGSGSGANSILSGGTTGLGIPIRKSGIEYVGGNTASVCVGGVNRYGSCCGYQVTESGIKLYRSWRIPDGDNNYFTEPYTFRECIVSPGRKRITGFAYNGSGYTGSGVCGCNSSVNTRSDGLGQNVYGPEASDFHLAYPDICEADKAFARSINTIAVSGNQYLIATYSLEIKIDTKEKPFVLTPVLTNPYSGISGEGYNNWTSVSGRHSIIHPGIKLINDGSVTSQAQADQINDSYIFRSGESYVPRLGIPMEPSCPRVYRFGYISNDNLIAIVNETGNPSSNFMNTGAYAPFSLTGRPFPNGLIGYFKSEFYNAPNFFYSKPRSERNANTNYASPTNYQSGNLNSFDNFFGTGQSFYPTTLSTPNNGISDSFDLYVSTGRSRSKTLSFQFTDPALPNRIPVRAFVMGYKPLLDTTDAPYNYFPSLDSLFLPLDNQLNFVQDPITFGFSTTNILASLFFPTGSGAYYKMATPTFDPRITGNTVSTYGNTGVSSAGYFVSISGYNRSFDMSFTGGLTPDPLLIERDFPGSNNAAYSGDIALTGYMVPTGISGSFTGLSGLICTGNLPVLGRPFAVILGTKSISFPSYAGGASPYVPVNRYYLSGFTGVYTGYGLTSRAFFTGFCTFSGHKTPIYVNRVSYIDSLINAVNVLDVNSFFSGKLDSFSYYTDNISTTYSKPKDLLLSDPLGTSGGYNYMDENNILQFQFKLNWSSPCLSSVSGC